MPVALPVSLGGALSALPDPASIDDHIVVVGVTIDPNGAEGEAVDPHDKSPNRQRTRPAHQPSGGDGYQSQPPASGRPYGQLPPRRDRHRASRRTVVLPGPRSRRDTTESAPWRPEARLTLPGHRARAWRVARAAAD